MSLKIEGTSKGDKMAIEFEGYSAKGVTCSGEFNEINKKTIEKYHKSKKGLTSKIYSHQKSHSKTRSHAPPEYTSKELREWLFSQHKFHELYNSWKLSGYIKNKRPSVDRVDDDIHYRFGNIELKTWEENNKKGHSNRKAGISTQGSLCSAVVQINLCGNVVAEYISQQKAFRQTGISQSNIGECCRGIRGTAGGYEWKQKEEYYGM